MNNRKRSGVSVGVLIILMILSFAVGAGVGIGGWIYVMGGSGEASRPIEDVIAESQSNSENNESTPDETTVEDQTVDEPTTDTIETATFTIVSEQSSASFTLEEDLRGTRTTVVGTTSEVGGTIKVNLNNPSASTIGTIAINARTLSTDSDMRNRAIRSDILHSAQDEYEFIIFAPQSLSNFSAESASVGDILTFDIAGNLTIAGITQAVTFNASVTVDSETQISGTATANVLRSDFNLTIPNVPSVANVTDDVDLTLTFVAVMGEA